MIVLVLVATAFAYAGYARADIYGGFVKGAGEGVKTAFEIIPYLAAALLMTGMLRASGVTDWLSQLLAPVFQLLGIPTELLTLLMVRPLSGSAALSELDTLISLYGPDSFQVRAACCTMGSSETVLYTAALYLGSIQVKSSGYILPIGLISSLIGAIFAVFLCKIL